MDVYIPKKVQQFESFYGPLPYEIDRYPAIKDHLDALASRMHEGVSLKNEAVLTEIANFHRDHLGRPPRVLENLSLGLEDCRHAIANEYGFRRWSEVLHLNYPYDSLFERSVNTFLEGELRKFRKLILQNPGLVNRKSQFGHRATLLHYAVCNGVELWRQKVPMNLPDLVAFLIAQGVNKEAKMTVYGGEYTAAELLLSSAHLRDAGIFHELRAHFEH